MADVSTEVPASEEAPKEQRHPVLAVLLHPIGKLLFKIALAAGILAWLVSSGRLKAEDLKPDPEKWPWLLYGVAMMLPGFLIASWRFQVLLCRLEMPCTYGRALTWTMVGSFFDVAMPSSTGGDVVKALYVMGAYEREKRARAVLSVLVDRVMGLFGLFFLSLLVCLISWFTFSPDGNAGGEDPGLRQRTGILLLLCCGAIAGFYLFASRRMEESTRRKKLVAWLPWGAKLEKLYMGFAGLRKSPRALGLILGLSVLNHAIWCSSQLALAEGLGMHLDWLAALVVIPIAVFFNVFGFAGGFGAGDWAYDYFFRTMLGVEGGASLGFAYRVISLIVRLVAGLPFYLLSGKPLKRGEL